MNCPLPLISPLSAALPVWEKELEEDEDRVFIIDGIKNGFRLTEENLDVKSVECNNYVSATRSDRIQVVESQLKEEIKLGHFIKTAKKPIIVNAIGDVPKNNIPRDTL